MQSGFMKIGWADAGKAVLIAMLTSIVTGLLAFLQADPPVIPTFQQLGALLTVGLGAGLSYLVKNFFTNAQNQLGKPDPPKNVTPDEANKGS